WSGEAWIVHQLGHSDRLAKRREVLWVHRRDRHVAVRRSIVRVCWAAPPGRADRLLTGAKEVEQVATLKDQLRSEQRDLDFLSLSGSLAGEERRTDGQREEHCADLVCKATLQGDGFLAGTTALLDHDAAICL